VLLVETSILTIMLLRIHKSLDGGKIINDAKQVCIVLKSLQYISSITQRNNCCFTQLPTPKQLQRSNNSNESISSSIPALFVSSTLQYVSVKVTGEEMSSQQMIYHDRGL